MTRAHLTIACMFIAGMLPVAAFAQTPAPAAPKPAASPVKKLSTKQPIEITSDSLEVYQEENRAVFIGNVVAIQGDTRLKSDKMTVFYRKPDENAEAGEKKPKTPKAPGADSGPKQDAIKHIDVEGHVFMSRPEDTATGETGSYDVENHEIRLNDKVTLTHGNNTLKGEHLTYNLDTGKSVLIGGPEAAASAKPAQTPPSGRVRALFLPGDKSGTKTETMKTPGVQPDNAAKTTDKKPETTSTAP